MHLRHLRGAVACATALLGIAPAHATSCGPNLLTYAATLDDSGTFNGIRCVAYTWYGSPGGTPWYTLQWYGEGRDANGALARSVGSTDPAWPGSLPITASSANIYGNGENYMGIEIGTVRPIVTEDGAAPAVIHMTGPLRQTWRLAADLPYVMQPPPTVCGPRFTTYEVHRTAGAAPLGNVSGLRCVLPLSGGFVWFGVQDGKAQLGSALGSSALAAVAGICDVAGGQACNVGRETRSIAPSTYGTGYKVTGPTIEYWLVPGSYTPPPQTGPAPAICVQRPWQC